MSEIKTCSFGGSRSLPAPFAPLVARLVSAWLDADPAARVSVGCAVGADSFVVQACPPSRLSIFAFFGSDGSGAWSGSAVRSVLSAAAHGADVSWFAGGSPAVPFRARLMRRSLAALAEASCAVFFLASPSSPGSLAVAAAAARAGQPVFVFCCGFAGSPAPLAGLDGAWSPSSFCGFPCLAWQPAAEQLNLF